MGQRTFEFIFRLSIARPPPCQKSLTFLSALLTRFGPELGRNRPGGGGLGDGWRVIGHRGIGLLDRVPAYLSSNSMVGAFFNKDLVAQSGETGEIRCLRRPCIRLTSSRRVAWRWGLDVGLRVGGVSGYYHWRQGAQFVLNEAGRWAVTPSLVLSTSIVSETITTPPFL